MGYAFRNRRQNRLKLLIWDGTGVWLCQRRLHRGHFIWPSADTPVCALTAAQWQWLITLFSSVAPTKTAANSVLVRVCG